MYKSVEPNGLATNQLSPLLFTRHLTFADPAVMDERNFQLSCFFFFSGEFARLQSSSFFPFRLTWQKDEPPEITYCVVNQNGMMHLQPMSPAQPMPEESELDAKFTELLVRKSGRHKPEISFLFVCWLLPDHVWSMAFHNH